MNQKTQKLLLVLAIPILSVGLGTAYGQQTTSDITIHHYGIAFASFVASGVFYSASGWIKRIRRVMAGDPTVYLDYTKMGKSILIGVMLGIGAFMWTTYEGDTISIHTPHEFLIQVGINTSAILLVDKWILGRSKKQDEQPGTLNVDDFDEVDDETVPPGKGE